MQRLYPLPSTVPRASMTTAPTGTSPASPAWRAISSAACMPRASRRVRSDVSRLSTSKLGAIPADIHYTHGQQRGKYEPERLETHSLAPYRHITLRLLCRLMEHSDTYNTICNRRFLCWAASILT